MQVGKKSYRTIWPAANGRCVEIIDQTRLPHEFVTLTLSNLEACCQAISEMAVRGAPLIGATAAYGICLGLQEGTSDQQLKQIAKQLIGCRPTAINLRWAVERMQKAITPFQGQARLSAAYQEAATICDEDAQANEQIGDIGFAVIKKIWQQKRGQQPVRILTHCNAGWLATVDWGTALAPIFKAHAAGIPLMVWVDETRPRNQGAALTCWELQNQGINHRLIVDNAGGHLMQHQQVDLCLVGSDRTSGTGDVCNKIGTYLKALAAHDNQVPFYVALPTSTLDLNCQNGVEEIPIEEREEEEVCRIRGRNRQGEIDELLITLPETRAANPAFDVTPARLVTGLITEKGICQANAQSIQALLAG